MPKRCLWLAHRFPLESAELGESGRDRDLYIREKTKWDDGLRKEKARACLPCL